MAALERKLSSAVAARKWAAAVGSEVERITREARASSARRAAAAVSHHCGARFASLLALPLLCCNGSRSSCFSSGNTIGTDSWLCLAQGSLLDTVGASLRSNDSTGGACHHAAPAALTLRGARALGRKW